MNPARWKVFVDGKLAAMDAEIENQRQALRKLEATRNALAMLRDEPPDWLAELAQTSLLAAEEGPRSSASGGGDLRLPPAEAVDALVAREPGLTRRQIMDRLEPVVVSSARRPRPVISGVIGRRLREGLFAIRRGRIWLNTEGGESDRA